MSPTMDTALKDVFHMPTFRHGQREIISSVLENKDVLALMPTGGGKSLCYQLPAMVKQGLTVVVSPLVALMNDQVQSLRSLGLPAGAIHSGLSMDERKAVFEEMKTAPSYLLYVSPERVQKPGFSPWLKQQNLSLIAIDEAHCVSQWGHDFRPEYTNLSVLRHNHPEVPIIALTATATPLVKRDIIEQLHLSAPDQHVYGFYRPNLFYQIEFCDVEEQKEDYVLQAISQYPEGRCLIYCGTRKKTEQWAQVLQERGEQVAFYHAGLSSQKRTQIEKDYHSGKVRILVATNAFGMGIDHPDVRLVAHTQMPGNIESYYQEVGRAGRDGKESLCLMTYSKKDKGLQSFFINQSTAAGRIKAQRWTALNAMIQYAESSECRHGGILTYFKDQKRIERCGHCDICSPNSERLVAVQALWTRPENTKAEKKVRKRARKWAQDPEINEEHTLRMEVLREWRKTYAKERDLPAFIIFGDKTLKDLALRLPKTEDALGRVYGLGDKKIEQFGKELLEVLQPLE